MWRLYIVIAALFSIGCADVATELVMDPNLTPRQMEAVVLSAEYWCDKGEECLPVSVGENNGNGYVTRQSSCIPDRAGYMSRGSLEIHFCDDREHLLDRVAPHEIGHAIGKHHVGKRHNIMSRFVEYQPIVIDLD